MVIYNKVSRLCVFFKKWALEWLFRQSKRVYLEVEALRTSLNTNKLERKINVNLVSLGKAIYKLNGQDIFFLKKDPAVSFLINKIREDKNLFNNINKQNNFYLSNIYVYISKRISHVFYNPL